MAPPGVLCGLILLCLLTATTQAVLPKPPIPEPFIAAIAADTNGGNTTFEQLIDHDNPSQGTFSQRYWWNTTYWQGPGSPVVIFTPGESNAEFYTGYLTNRSLVGLYAQAIGGAMIIFEHRYWGESSPFQILDTQNLTYLTLNNSVADMVRFAKTVKLPFDDSGQSNAQKAPWIHVGGSYSGALTAWVDKLSPGTFWASHSSSAPVQAVRDYWMYSTPILEGMPRNCSADLVQITEYIDALLDEGNRTAIQELKESFGLEALEDDDFAAAVSISVSSWQSIQLTSGYSQFYQMCDTIHGLRPVDKGDNSTIPSNSTLTNITIPDTGVGLHLALPKLAAWTKYEGLPGTCGQYGYPDWQDPNSVGCFDSYNTSSPIFADWLVNNTINRQWLWMLCNEPFFYWQTGAPEGQPSLVSRLANVDYYMRYCPMMFPAQGNYTYGSARGLTVEAFNEMTGGWFVNTTRLIWVNGQFDPWSTASVSSPFRPGGPLTSTPETPVHVVPGARHCNDLITRSGEVNEDMASVQTEVIATMVRWVDDFYKGVSS